MFLLVSCRVIHDFKASNELITQPLYQSIVIRYVESCKHTFSRNFFCKSFVYNFFIWVKGTTTPINHTVTSSSVIFWKLSLFRYVLLWTKMVIIGSTHLKKIGKGENHEAYNQIATENNGVNSSHHQHFTFLGNLCLKLAPPISSALNFEYKRLHNILQMERNTEIFKEGKFG